MKLRNGFVSNSSSSSFILVFDKPVESRDELASLMGECGVYDEYYARLSTHDVVDIVWDRIQRDGIAKSEDIISEFSYDFEAEFPARYHEIERELEALYRVDRNDDTGAKLRALWEEQHQIYEATATVAAEKYLAQRANKAIYIMEFEDSFSVGAAMEHGEVFGNIEHLRISKH